MVRIVPKIIRFFRSGNSGEKAMDWSMKPDLRLEIYSLAHMMNIFARRGYELDRILPHTDPDDVFDQWNVQYVFRKQAD